MASTNGPLRFLARACACVCLGASVLHARAQAQTAPAQPPRAAPSTASPPAPSATPAQSPTRAPAAPSAAQPSAKELFELGRVAYDRGDYQTAVSEWKRAYDVDPRPGLQYNLAQAYEKLDMLLEAVGAMESYLQGAPADHPYQTDARAKIGGMRERLEKTGIQLSGGPEGATIFVDGEDWGRLPRRDPIKLTPGTHAVRVEAAGHQPFEVRVAVSAGKTLAVEVQMGAAQSSTDNFDAATADEPVDESGGGPNLLPWILVGGGGALTVTGIVLGTIALGKAEDAPSDDSPEADSARGLALGADVFIFGGIGVAATGAVLWLLDQDAATDAAGVRVRPWAERDRLGAVATGAF
jgi:hypothetical protein